MATQATTQRVGVVGAGLIGSDRLRVWQDLGAPIAGAWTRGRASSRKAIVERGCTVFDTIPDLLAQADIADICLPTYLHRSAVAMAAQANCHIVCEKPLAIRADDVEAMFQCCDDADVRLFVAMVVRFFPAYRHVWRIAREGRLGPVREIRLKRVGSPPPPLGSWFLDDECSGGMLTDLLIHDVDYATWLAGDVGSVHARTAGNGQHQYAHITLEHLDGAVSRIEGGWVDDAPNLQTGGSVRCADGDIPIALTSQYTAMDDPYVRQLRHFRDALADDQPFLVSADEALHVARILDAARESARRRKPVTLATTAESARDIPM